MIRLAGVTIAALVIVSISCGRDIRDLAVTDQNKDSFMTEIGQSKGLTVEEAGLLAGYMARYEVAVELEKLGQKNQLSPVGKTVRALIREQAVWREAERVREAEAKRIVAETEAREKQLVEAALAREESLSAELSKAIRLAVYQKDFLASSWEQGRYDDHIVLRVTYENTSPTGLRAFSGVIEFKDLFGDPVTQLFLKVTDPISSGKKASNAWWWEYNRFNDELTQLKNTTLNDLKVEWHPMSIIFTDGTTLGVAASARGE